MNMMRDTDKDWTKIAETDPQALSNKVHSQKLNVYFDPKFDKSSPMSISSALASRHFGIIQVCFSFCQSRSIQLSSGL